MRRLVSLLLASLAIAGCGVSALQPAGPAPQRLDALKAKLPRVEAVRFSQVDAKLYRGGLPSEADLAALDKAGVKTVISLQNIVGHEKAVVEAEQKMVEKLGMTFVNLSLPWRKAPPEAMVKSFFKVFADADDVPAYVHCKQGRDRTGTMVAIYRVQFNDYTPAKAFEEMKSFGFEPKDYPYFAQYVQDFKPLKLATGRKAAAFSTWPALQ